MDYEKRAMTEAEDKYTFRQSSQISSQTGLIGYLRMDMDTDGKGFFSTWNGWNDRLKTQEFKDEFDKVINSLREEGDILHDRSSLSKYCYSTPQAKMNTDREYYGVRVDTEKYSYLLRLCPLRGEYNLYCYCYEKQWLDRHIKEAEKGIRFITPHYTELFRIQDGESVRFTHDNGSYSDKVCRYVDAYHLEAGNAIYHICELAERLEASGSTVIPLRKSLPEQAYVYVASEDCIARVTKGQSGYEKTDYGDKLTEPAEKEALTERMNSKNGITKAQAQAMAAGSMFGWETPAANPKNYDAEGRAIKPKNRDRGDAR